MNAAQRRRDIRLRYAYPILSSLPLGLAYALTDVLGGRDARHNDDLRIALTNGFTRAWPEIAPALREDLIREQALMLAREVMDAWLLPRLDAQTLAAMVAIDDLAPLDAARAEGRGVLLVMAHYSRLILMLAALGARGYGMGMLTMRIDAANPDLLPSEQGYLARKVAALRAMLRGGWVSLGDPMRPLYEGLRRGEIWIVLLDAYHPGFGRQADYPFLDGVLTLPSGIDRIMAKTGARAVFASVRETGPQRLHGRLVRLPDEPEQAMPAAVAELEADVRTAPAQWWQWNILEYLWRRGGRE